MLKKRLNSLIRFKKLFINFSFRSAANLFSKLLSLITLPIITRALGPEAFGNYNLVTIIANYTMLPIGIMGLRSYGIREIAAKRKENSYALNILSMQFTISLLAVLISLIITYIIFKSQLLLFTAIIFGYILVFSRSFDLEFFYVSQKDLVFPTVASIIGQLFYVAGVVLFIKNPNDFVVLVLLSSLTPTISAIIQLYKYGVKYSPIKLYFNIKEAILTFKQTYKLGIAQNLEGFIPTIPQILIPSLIGTYALGIFSGGYKVYTLLVMFYVTFFYALAPYIVQLNNYNKTRRRKYHLLIFLIIFSISCLIGLGLFLFGEPLVILILGKGFGGSVLIFKIISLTLIPLAPVVMLLGSIFIYSGLEKYYLVTLIISGIITIILSPLLINYYQAEGAVYTMAITLICSIILLSYFYFKYEKLQHNSIEV